MVLGKRRPPRRPAQGRQARETGSKNRLPVDSDAMESVVTDATVLEVLRLSHDGRGVARQSDGKTVFIDQALPGERVSVRIHRQRSRYNEAHVVEWLSTSADRVEPPCQHFGHCGGCRLQHMQIEAQRAFKKQVLNEHLSRESVAVEVTGTIADAGYGYRRRARLGVKQASHGEVHFGFRREGSDRLFNIVECPVLVPALQQLLPHLRTLLESLEAPGSVGHIELIAADATSLQSVSSSEQMSDTEAEYAVLYVRQIHPHEEDESRWQAFAESRGIMLVFDRGERQALSQEVFYFVPSDEQSPLAIGFRPGDFIQINGKVNRQLVDRVLMWAGQQSTCNIVDLFAGVGNFTLPLAQRGMYMRAIEGSESMVKQLKSNAARLGLHVEARAQDLSQAPSLDNADIVLLDPPRGGANAVVHSLGQMPPSTLIYVSCDPTTLARDAAVLTKKGYRLKHIDLVDMFPQTAHMESISLFERT